MGILRQLLGGKSGEHDYSDPDQLRVIWDSYSSQWPNNNDQYGFWKPASVLPAPKWAVKQAIKLGYREWPEPIHWTIFSAFFTEFVDLGSHLPQEAYDTIENFRKRPVKCCGKENKRDPLLMFAPIAHGAASLANIDDIAQRIVHVRDGLRRSVAWDPVDTDDRELDVIRKILLDSTTESCTLMQEWRFYILSIGRDRYVTES